MSSSTPPSRAFMGLTVACARCHDHKFDPIPQADYYSLAGIFKSSKTMENFNVVAKWHEYVLAPEAEREKLKEHKAKIEAKNKEIGRISEGGEPEADDAKRARMRAITCWRPKTCCATKDSPAARSGGREDSAGAVRRAAGSFDRGNAPRTLEKEKPNAPKGVKGPFFAEYDITVPAAGDYQLDFLEEEVGRGTVDVRINGVLEQRGKRPVENREASPDAGGWSVTGVFPLKPGSNTIRLEHKSRFPYFEALMVSACRGARWRRARRCR